jgi:predicted secreted hydrolase
MFLILTMVQIGLSGCQEASESVAVIDPGDTLSLSEAMAGDPAGYARATAGLELEFPRDFAAHPDFRTEWWYVTGNLGSADGQRFGYEFTIFRTALRSPSADTSKGVGTLSSGQLYMGHAALTFSGPDKQAFSYSERFGRDGLGLAGAESSPFKVWLEDWAMESEGPELFPMTISASSDEFSIDLQLDAAKPMILQGEDGFDQKGPEVGNASYYYSFTRLGTTGTVQHGDDSYDVSGYSWKDHEWSTSALGEDQVGWDWVALQLSNNYEIMFYGLRDAAGIWSGFTNGVLVGPDGEKESLQAEDVRISVLDWWESPHSDARYPSGWQFDIPEKDIELTVVPLVKDQEMNVSVRYWEGAVSIKGIYAAQSVDGYGYVELTGYEKQR